MRLPPIDLFGPARHHQKMDQSSDYLETGGHPVCHSLWSKILCRGDLKNVQPIIAKAPKTNDRRWSRGPQLATYPQSPLSGPAGCSDVAYLSQAFSQPTGPGRLWISLGASSLFAPTEATPAPY